VADRARRPGARLFAALLLAGAAAGCAPARTPPPPPAPAARAEELDAVAALLRLEDRRDFDSTALAGFAASPLPATRARTAVALGRLRRVEGLGLLRSLLADPDTTVAANAAFALGLVGDSTAVRDLAGALTPASAAARPTIAAEAAYALGKLRSREAADSLLALLARAPLDGPAEPAGSALLAVWRFPRPGSLEPVLRWLDAPDPELRWRAVYALVRRPDPRATRRLMTRAGDGDARVRALTLRGLAASLADSSGVGAAVTLPLVIAALQDTSYSVRIEAARTLGSYPRPEAVAALAGSLTRGDRHLAVAALEALGRIGPAAVQAAPALRGLVLADTTQLFVRQTALESLARIQPAAASQLAASLVTSSSWRLRGSAARVFAVTGGPRDARLLTLIEDADGRVSASALQAAVDAAGDSVRVLRSVLLRELGAPDIFVRVAAIAGLGKLTDPATLPQLLDAYDVARRDSLDDAALAALDALAVLRGGGQDPAHAFFLRFPRPEDPLLRLRAVERFGDAARAAWGEPLPIDTRRSPAEYRALVDRFAAPAADPEVEIVTESGTLRLRLFGAAAPLTVENFLRLAGRGYFDGQEWPRVVPNFVVQGGDPRGDTNGGPGYAIRDEIGRRRYSTGTLGMALSGPDTGGSQFFVTHSPQPHLDGIYTIFGEIIAGQDVAETILPGERILRVRQLP
jgi:cyclophilin family peptidyl-prolyl cis-trans isomerase/HEAT repeat protein